MGFRSRGQTVMDDHYATERQRKDMTEYFFSIIEDTRHINIHDLHDHFVEMWIDEAGIDLIEDVWFEVLEKAEK